MDPSETKQMEGRFAYSHIRCYPSSRKEAQIVGSTARQHIAYVAQGTDSHKVTFDKKQMRELLEQC